MDINRVEQLFQLYFQKSISEQEKRELFEFLSEMDEKEIETLLSRSFQANFGVIDSENYIDTSKVWFELTRSLDFKQSRNKKYNLRWLTISSIAAIFLSIAVFGLITYLKNQKFSSFTENIVVQHDIPPGGNTAVLTLANGKKVDLDTLSIGGTISDGNILIEKLEDGNIRYLSNAVDEYTLVYNTVETPIGGTYQVILPDGSKVWMNAMSKLKYPTRFNENSRDVELEGEAYFEIAHNKNSPFFVHLASQNKIKVLGTKFNVNSYSPDADITSVLEGAVNVYNTNRSKVVTRNQGLTVRDGVFDFSTSRNVLEDISWVDGYFCHSSVKLKDLLNQVSRWYGIDVENKDNLNNEFVLSLKRDVYLKDLIKILELTNEVKLELKNNVLYVKKGEE